MQKLNLPTYSFQWKEENGKTYIFDSIRKKYLVCSPEEWVRQNFVQYLIHERNCPSSLLVLEKGLKLNQLQKRADVLVYDNQGLPLALVECKAHSVRINQETFDQIARYNIVFKVPFLIVTNGLEHYCCKIDWEQKSFSFLEKIPDYNAML